MVKNKLILGIMLIALVLNGLFFGIGAAFAGNETSVSGLVSSDTIWTKANSPYSLTGPITVGNGATLTIGDGVTVNLNGYNIQVNGALRVMGTWLNKTTLSSHGGNANIFFSASIIGYSEQTGQGSLIENTILNQVSIHVSSSSPTIRDSTIQAASGAVDGSAILVESGAPVISGNIIAGDIENLNDAAPTITRNTIKGGIYGMGMLTSAPIITRNTITGGSSHNYGVGIRADGSNTYIADNIITNCSIGIELYDGASVVERNLVANNSWGIKLDAHMSPVTSIIRNNSIFTNLVGVSNNDNHGALTLSYNNIEQNANNTLQRVDAMYNWWGTDDEQLIRQILPDSVTFMPFLTESNPNAYPIFEDAPSVLPDPRPLLPEPQLSISVDTSAATVGSTVYINGVLGLSNETVLENQKILLYYSIEGSNWIPIGSGKTDSFGNYSIQWASAASGTFGLRVEWDGNGTYAVLGNETTLSFLPYHGERVFFVESNSTVTQLVFNSTRSELSFSVSGPSESMGYVKAIIAKSLIQHGEDIKVILDGSQLYHTVTAGVDSWLLTFVYHHSTHQVTINLGANASPSNQEATPSDTGFWAAAAALLVAVAIVMGVCLAVWQMKKRSKTTAQGGLYFSDVFLSYTAANRSLSLRIRRNLGFVWESKKTIYGFQRVFSGAEGHTFT